MIDIKGIKKELNYFDLKPFTDNILIAVVNHYVKGGKKVSDKIGAMPVRPKKSDLKEISGMVIDLIKGVTSEMSKSIRREIRESILNGEDNKQLAKRLDNIFKGNNPTRFRYEDRLKMIARTESARAHNVGALNTAKKLGAKKKWLYVIEDERTSGICSKFHKKYGDESQSIDIDDEFSIIYDGKEYKNKFPPFHPNCRTIVMFEFD